MVAHRLSIALAALTFLACGVSTAPDAQARAKHSTSISADGKGQGMNIPSTQQSPVTDDDEPDFSIFGVPVRISSPVAKPYQNTSFQTYQGSAMTSQDALLSDTIPNIDDWTP
ncbi:Hypothetical protein GbCGDNIH6_7129 [Granulibacter bethesdensis]|uniref:hypothetical protein n=1 Tax=Granulibacter bethesdensis TaxID=364410 RepID=UPI000909DE5B|nr:hypothetical protein [Granulibacter bethesdensis]APH56861.1 Hypothetical protein GbCGDNIH6_7129 [Granulibacter bethesdensis]